MNSSQKLLLYLVAICFMQAPIYVNKEIVLADAIRISHGMGTLQSTKSVYDVTLDRYAC